MYVQCDSSGLYDAANHQKRISTSLILGECSAGRLMIAALPASTAPLTAVSDGFTDTLGVAALPAVTSFRSPTHSFSSTLLPLRLLSLSLVSCRASDVRLAAGERWCEAAAVSRCTVRAEYELPGERPAALTAARGDEDGIGTRGAADDGREDNSE